MWQVRVLLGALLKESSEKRVASSKIKKFSLLSTRYLLLFAMYDFHTHSLLSDGELLPSELARRYEAKGYKAIAITDHTDASNIKMIVPAIVEFCKRWPKNRIKVIPGIELTHIPLEHFDSLIRFARKKGIKIIVAHGQTLCEPVFEGTNLKALNSDIDILAHPGNISESEVRLAKKRGIFLEVTTRKGHNATNRHVVRLARKHKAHLVINNDAHAPEDIISIKRLKQFASNVGLSASDVASIWNMSEQLLSKS